MADIEKEREGGGRKREREREKGTDIKRVRGVP